MFSDVVSSKLYKLILCIHFYPSLLLSDCAHITEPGLPLASIQTPTHVFNRFASARNLYLTQSPEFKDSSP